MNTISQDNADKIRIIATIKSYDSMYIGYLCFGYLSFVKFLEENEAEIREINLKHSQAARCIDALMRG